LRWLFRGLEPDMTREPEDAVEWFTIAAGTVLFKEGDEAPDAFVVTSGQLGVFLGSESNRKLIAKINVGQMVGEMALITEGTRSATVAALRNSDLVRLPRAIVDRLLQCNPETALYMLRLLASRLRDTTRHAVPKESLDRVAIVALGPVKQFDEALRWLTEEANANAITISNGEEEYQWRHSAEQHEHFITYISESHDTAWARHCIRQAERVVFIADADAGITGTEAIAFANHLHREADLVLVNKANAAAATGGGRLVAAFPGRAHPARPGRQRSGLRPSAPTCLPLGHLHRVFGRRGARLCPYRRNQGVRRKRHPDGCGGRHQYGRADCRRPRARLVAGRGRKQYPSNVSRT
jgi:CRP-like cAMP-binding protein